jgi:diacylglycerol kinase (ATP)
MSKIKFIYNPKAGEKRGFFSRKKPGLLLYSIHALLKKYEIVFDEAPTKGPGDGRRLAVEASKEGYDTVIVAGGDGTVGEVANGLIGTDVALGILPLGTFMNVARMLSIPFDLEQAVMVIKMRNTRLIDAGEVVSIEGERPGEPSYFLETAGIGIEADFQHEFLAWERGDKAALGRFLKRMSQFYRSPLKVELDNGRSFESRAHVITISNGPYADAAIPVAPSAKLNDHVLTVRRYHMSKLQLLQHVLRLKILGVYKNTDIETYTSTIVRITSQSPRPVHADARVFGDTPILIKVRPNALKVIAGYPEFPQDSALLAKKVYLSP